MWQAKRFSWAAALAGVVLLAGGASIVISQEKKTDVKQTSAPMPSATRPLDISKSVRIEPPVRTIVTKASAPVAATSGDKFVNPKVQPGKVRWHPTLVAACAAASKSKKPVLLFQMMGKLDNRFC